MSGLWIDGVFVDRLWADGVDVADGWLDGVYFSLMDEAVEPISPPTGPPVISNHVAFADRSMQALSAPVFTGISGHFLAIGADTVTYAASSSETFVTATVQNGLLFVTPGYAGQRVDSATVTVTATATNDQGTDTATGQFDVALTLTNRIIVPVTDIRPPAVASGNNGSYEFVGVADTMGSIPEPVDNPTWQDVIDVHANSAFTQIGIYRTDADGDSLAARFLAIEAAVDTQGLDVIRFQRGFAEHLIWEDITSHSVPDDGPDLLLYTNATPSVGGDVVLGDAIGDGRAYFIFDWN